jgi:hypothetical protein
MPDMGVSRHHSIGVATLPNKVTAFTLPTEFMSFHLVAFPPSAHRVTN